METIHEECTLWMNSEDFLSDIKSIRNISLNTIPTVSKATLAFSDGNLSRNVIKYQFWFLMKQPEWRRQWTSVKETCWKCEILGRTFNQNKSYKGATKKQLGDNLLDIIN